MDVCDIMDLLPHRYPFLMLDQVHELLPGEKIVASKNVTINDQFFNGHFPQHPIMPGVLIIEAMAQAAGIMIMKDLTDQRDNIVYLMSVEKSNFRQPVVPGDVLTLEVTLISGRSSAWKCSGEAKVNGKLMADSRFIVAKSKSEINSPVNP